VALSQADRYRTADVLRDDDVWGLLGTLVGFVIGGGPLALVDTSTTLLWFVASTRDSVRGVCSGGDLGRRRLAAFISRSSPTTLPDVDYHSGASPQ
jgi:hypothetical protein